MNQPRILIVEDDPKIAATLKLYLEREGYQARIATDGKAALQTARAYHPSLILLDVMLPELSGVEVCRILRSESDVYIILLTALSTETDKLRGLNLGADDYITKPFSPREVMARVRAILRRSRAEPRGPLEVTVKGLAINFERREVSVNGKSIYLTPAQFKLLETLVKSPERVFTRRELVERAFGDNYEGFERTIDAHVMSLRKKIETDRQQPSFIVTVYGVGYKFSSVDHAA